MCLHLLELILRPFSYILDRFSFMMNIPSSVSLLSRTLLMIFVTWGKECRFRPFRWRVLEYLIGLSEGKRASDAESVAKNLWPKKNREIMDYYQIYQTSWKYQRSQTELLQSVVWWQSSVRRGVCCQKSAPDSAQHTGCRRSWVWTFM